MAEKRYYWLKLKRDFFKRHDIRIVENMENGKDYILFYLKLLVESVDHEGELRFSETIPYNENMLATITDTNIDIVRQAMNIFTQLNMIEIVDNGTIYMNEVMHMIGSAADNDNAIRQQRYRDNQKALNTGVSDTTVTKSNAGVTECVTNSNESKSKSKSKRKSKIKENIEKKSGFVPPTLDEVKAYCKERGNNVDPEKFYEYYNTGNWKDGKGNSVKNWKQKVITWERNNTTAEVHIGHVGGALSVNPFTEFKKQEGMI